MGRPLRLQAKDVTYHITSRTNGGRLYMKTKKDHKALCKFLNRVLLKYGVTLHSYVPMTNHFHAILHISNQANLSQVIGEFKCLYAKYFNKKHNQSGHFWGDRFRSTIIQDDRHLLACLRYIDRNPVKAGLVDHPSKWDFASYSAYARGQEHPIFKIQLHDSYLALAHNESRRREIYRQFVENADAESDSLHGRLHRLPIYGTDEFVTEVMIKQL